MGHRPSILGQAPTAFSNTCLMRAPFIYSLITGSSCGIICATSRQVIGPFGMTWLARRPPPFERPMSVFQWVRMRSAMKLPRFVSSVLTRENLASSWTQQQPASITNFFLMSAAYSNTC